MLQFFARRMKELHKDDEHGEKGFTLIELLVVVIIIGILAAIAIPVYLDQREQSFGAAVQSDVRNGAGAATSFAADNNGSYAGLTAATLQTTYEWNLSPGVINPTAAPVAGDNNNYTLSAEHPDANATEDVCTFTSTTGRVTCN